MNKLILIIALVILLGGGIFLWKRKSSQSQAPMNIPPISAPKQWQSSWQSPGMNNQIPTGYAQIGGMAPTQNPGITRTFRGKTGGCGSCGG